MTENARRLAAEAIKDNLPQQGGDLDLLEALVMFIVSVPVVDDRVIMPTLDAFLQIMHLLGPNSEETVN